MSGKDEISTIEELAGLQFSIEQIALILEIDESEFDAPVYAKAYLRGKLKAEAEIRKSIFQLAKQGSTPAQKQMMEIIEKNTNTTPFPPPNTLSPQDPNLKL